MRMRFKMSLPPDAEREVRALVRRWLRAAERNTPEFRHRVLLWANKLGGAPLHSDDEVTEGLMDDYELDIALRTGQDALDELRREWADNNEVDNDE
jgi:hypothetical protein